jgi:hypothetical protein
MKRESSEILSAVFVDYDNIYLSLKRRNEEAAKRFAKDAAVWLKEIESGRLITPTNKLPSEVDRRIVLNRCYGNPVPRRNQHDNSTDMNSFPFIRHHFLRAGFEIIDCPPLTAQLKNSSDIRMVMDVRDFLHHETRFDEFVILSGDADFTPVLHRLRAHARRTVVFANDYTAAPYVAIADGEIREVDLVSLILEGKLPSAQERPAAVAARPAPETLRQEIMAEIVQAVRASSTPVPLEALAERALRAIGHEKTVGSNWAGAGSFRDLLLQSLPEGLRLTEQPPYLVYDPRRMIAQDPAQQPLREAIERAAAPAPKATSPLASSSAPLTSAVLGAARVALGTRPAAPASAPAQPAAREASLELPPPSPAPRQQAASRTAEGATALQESIARIHAASQAPPLSPPEYRALFELMAQEINESHMQGPQTLTNIANRARQAGLEVRADDVRFILDVVGEPDPWFEKGASATLFAGRFRNFVVARCRSQGLSLSSDELDLIDAWFTGGSSVTRTAASARACSASPGQRPAGSQQPAASSPAQAQNPEKGSDRWWALGGSSRPQPQAESTPGSTTTPSSALSANQEPSLGDLGAADEFPRIVRTRLRG